MHNPNYTANSTLIDGLQIQLRFTPSQLNSTAVSLRTEQQKLSEVIAQKIENKEFFYGIEISAHNFGGRKALLDYNAFGTILPLFTSLIWFGTDYAQIKSIDEVESIRTARILEAHTRVLPHFTAFRVDQQRLQEFSNLNFSNVLALRGDQFDAEQDFKHARDLIGAIRQLRGDTISIGAAGYPDGHIDANSLDEDIEFLAEKVKAGADFIITQVCFSADTIITFVRKCRDKGISIPIIVGVFIPENFRILERMLEITGAHIAPTLMEQFKSLSMDRKKFNAFAIENALKTIEQIFASDLNIYGVHFFTINYFKNVQQVVTKLTEKCLPNKID